MSRWRPLRRLPIRLKLTLLFALVMTVVLSTAGMFLYFRLKSELDRSIAQGLHARAHDLATLIRDNNPASGSGRETIPLSEEFAQILTAKGRVVEGTRQTRGLPLLSALETRRAAVSPILIDRGERARLLATLVRSRGGDRIVVVGASLADREHALETLAGELLIGGPLVLLIASGIAYGVAAAALRPVDAMRRRAATISAAEVGARLPLPQADDEIQRLGETLNEMLGRLERALARERGFVSDASHELRTPIAILKAELELALDDEISRGELQAAVRSAAEETDRLAQLAEDLLVLAQTDQGRLPIRPTVTAVPELLDQAAARFRARSRESGRRIEVEAPAGLRVPADPLRVEQALANLIDNALRYGQGTITLSGREHHGRIELHVRDEGEGFAPELIDGAFERFHRGDHAQAGAGAGLGLAIVRGIAHAHGGEAHARNRGSGGADVWLSLPARAAALATAGAQS